MTGTWLVRLIGDPTPRTLDDPHKVIDGLRDGDWEPSDEVRGPADTLWRPIEEHPTFADAVAEMGPPPPEHPDETKLDMNPLIDVALVLLVFFILTASVATLRRTIDIPPPQDEGGPPLPKTADVDDRIFRLKVSMDDKTPIVSINDRPIVFERLDQEVSDVVKGTGRKEMLLIATDDVPWEIFVKVQGAATEAGVHQIHLPVKRKK